MLASWVNFRAGCLSLVREVSPRYPVHWAAAVVMQLPALQVQVSDSTLQAVELGFVAHHPAWVAQVSLVMSAYVQFVLAAHCADELVWPKVTSVVQSDVQLTEFDVHVSTLATCAQVPAGWEPFTHNPLRAAELMAAAAQAVELGIVAQSATALSMQLQSEAAAPLSTKVQSGRTWEALSVAIPGQARSA